MRKSISILSFLVLVIITTITAYAAASPVSITFKLDNVRCTWNYPKAMPYIDELTHIKYVAIRPVAEALGYKWMADGKKITISKKNSVITFVGGTNECIVNGVQMSFKDKTVLKNQIYGSLDCFETLLGVSCDWDESAKTVLIYRVGTKAYYNAGKSDIALNFDSRRMKFIDQGVFDLNGTAMIPLNAVGPFLGYVTKTVGKDIILSKGVNSLSFRSGVNGAVSKNGVICIPAKTVSDTFKVPCDYFPEGKTVRMYTTPIDQVKIYTQLRDSGMFVLSGSIDGYGAYMHPKGMTDRMLSICVNGENSDLTMLSEEPYPEVRKVLKDIIKIQFPNNYEEIYNRCIKVMREETYKLKDCTSYNATDYDYFDGVIFYSSKQVINGTGFVLSFGKKGFIMPIRDEVDPFLKHSASLERYIDRYSLNE